MDEKDNSKIAYQDEAEDELKLGYKKYALFEIKTQEVENTVYLYCSDIERAVKYDEYFYGIFEGTTHISISVIACDTSKVMYMERMFYNCSNLTELDLKNFNTTNVENMNSMFYYCNSLTELDLKNFNTENVEDMHSMFSCCRNLNELDLKDFNTKKVTNMNSMFFGCFNLTELKFGKNFNITKDTDVDKIFESCIVLSKDKQNEILGKNK